MSGVCGRHGGEKKYKGCGEKPIRKEITSMTGVERRGMDPSGSG